MKRPSECAAKSSQEEIARRLAFAKEELRRAAADLTASAAIELLSSRNHGRGPPAARRRTAVARLPERHERPFTRPYAQAFLETAPAGYDLARFFSGRRLARRGRRVERAAPSAFFASPAVPARGEEPRARGARAQGRRRRVRLAVPAGHAQESPPARGRADPQGAPRPNDERQRRPAGRASPCRRRSRRTRRRRSKTRSPSGTGKKVRTQRRRRREDAWRLRGAIGSERLRRVGRGRDPAVSEADEGERESLNGNQGGRDHGDPEAAAGRATRRRSTSRRSARSSPSETASRASTASTRSCRASCSISGTTSSAWP